MTALHKLTTAIGAAIFGIGAAWAYCALRDLDLPWPLETSTLPDAAVDNAANTDSPATSLPEDLDLVSSAAIRETAVLGLDGCTAEPAPTGSADDGGML
jgi:hypothetical protein